MHALLLNLMASYLDMSKAFDKVWHKGLIVKLKSASISEALLELIKSFLTNRFQRVVLKWLVLNCIRVVIGKSKFITRIRFRSTLFSNIH